MDQTHTLTGGVTYRHGGRGVWLGSTIEYGSGTPMGHGEPGHAHAPGVAAHEDVPASGGGARVPGHVTASGSVGLNLWRDPIRRARLVLQLDVENLTNHVYVIAQEGEFSPAQFSPPRVVSLSARFKF